MLSQNTVGLPTSSIMTGLLTQRKRAEFTKNTSQLLPRETAEGTLYRVRLINSVPSEAFVNGSSFQHYRDFPFILQHTHTVWEEVPTDDPEKPTKRIPHTIVCPKTDYVKANSGLTKSSCPMCQAWNSAWKAFSDSKYKNVVAKERLHLLESNFRALVPVYVSLDPNREENIGSLKVIAFDEDCYNQLLSAIQSASQSGINVWNDNACDLCFSWGRVEKEAKNGKSYKKWGFTRLGFDTRHPTSCPGLTDEAIDSLMFDASWYTVPTKEELEEFYTTYCSSTSRNDAIAMDIPAIPSVAPVAVKKTAVQQKPAIQQKPAMPQMKQVIEDPVAEEVTEDSENIVDVPQVAVPKKAPAKKAVKAEEVPSDLNSQIDDIINGFMPQ